MTEIFFASPQYINKAEHVCATLAHTCSALLIAIDNINTVCEISLSRLTFNNVLTHCQSDEDSLRFC